MDGLLYLLAFLILMHNILLGVGLLQKKRWHRHWGSVVMALGMACAASWAVIADRPHVLYLGFATYRLGVAVESLLHALLLGRNVSAIVPINLLIVAGAIMAHLLESSLLMAISYILFWLLSFWMGRRLMHQKQAS